MFIYHTMAAKPHTPRYQLIEKHQKLLADIYRSQVLGHICLESFPEYLELSVRSKLAIKNELKLFNLKKPEYLVALKLIANKADKTTILNETGISERCYYRLLNIPLVRKYVYGEDIEVKISNSKQTELVTEDNLEDTKEITYQVENFYF